jgi:hypothetical protein
LWSIEYDGPRRPFTILKPDSIHWRGGRTTVKVWYARPDGMPGEFEYGLGGVPAGVVPSKQKDWFSVAVDGKPVTGKIVMGNGAALLDYIGREPRPGQPPLWVQLEHAPTDRGDGIEQVFNRVTGHITEGAPWSLDAWTGTLWSPVVEVALK